MLLRMGDFTDIEFLTVFIILLVSFVILNLVIISFLLVNRSLKNYQNKISKESITTRIFMIDLKNNLVTFFNRSDMKNKRKMNLGDFYEQFHQNDNEKVKNWIFRICTDHKNVDQYLEADVLLNRGKISYFSLLKLIKYDPKVGIIHLESHILRYITPTNYSSRKKDNLVGVVKRSSMANAISKQKSLRGFTFAIRFFYIRQKALSNDKVERYMIMTLKNEIYPFATGKRNQRQIIEDVGSELMLFDLHLDSRDQAQVLASSIAHSLRKSIGVNGFAGSVNFAIGVVENKQYYQDFDSIVNKAKEACINAQQSGQEIYIYQKSYGPLTSELTSYSNEIESLMKPNALRYLFRPIIDVSKHRTIGYFEFVRAYNSPFANFFEMSKYAAKVGKNRELFATVAKSVIPKFAAERPNITSKLFFNVSMLDIDHMIEILPQIFQSKEIKLVLVFDEQEVNENASQLDLLKTSLMKFHGLGYQLALLHKDKNLLLDPSVYSLFDYFVVGVAMLNEIKKNNRIRLSVHNLIEELLNYDRPIIATDLEGWQAIELIIKSGINLISSEAVSASNDMLLPVEKKKMDKLTSMEKNFR